MKTLKEIKIVSLFSCGGVAETYLNRHPFRVMLANEIDEKRVRYYKDLHPEVKVIPWDITNPSIYNNMVSDAVVMGCNFLLATPPCQWMSNAWKRDKNDSRNNLIKYVIQFIKDTNIDYALIENVPSMPKYPIMVEGKEVTIRDFIHQSLSDKYDIEVQILNSADFGVPQSRKRVFIGISKKGYKGFNLGNLEKSQHISVRDAIWHLPSLESWEKADIPYHYAKVHNDRHILCMSHTPSWKTALDNEVYYPKKDGRKVRAFKTTYKRASRDKPLPTITMHNGDIASQNNVHPWRKKEDWTYSDARVLTLKELFICSSLPDNYKPPEFASDNFTRQILGEWIPPLLVLKIIQSILE